MRYESEGQRIDFCCGTLRHFVLEKNCRLLIAEAAILLDGQLPAWNYCPYCGAEIKFWDQE